MKKKQFKKMLTINKMTVTKLDSMNMNKIRGGPAGPLNPPPRATGILVYAYCGKFSIRLIGQPVPVFRCRLT